MDQAVIVVGFDQVLGAEASMITYLKEQLIRAFVASVVNGKAFLLEQADIYGHFLGKRVVLTGDKYDRLRVEKCFFQIGICGFVEEISTDAKRAGAVEYIIDNS